MVKLVKLQLTLQKLWQNAQIKFQEGSNYADLTTNKVTFDCYQHSFDGLLKLEESLGGQAAVQQSFQHTGSGWEAISVVLDLY